MTKPPPSLPDLPDTIASLRELYRSSEAKAARLRLLIEAGRDLSAATKSNLEDILNQSARRAAHFAGYQTGGVTREAVEPGIPLIAPGNRGRRVGTLILTGRSDQAGPMNADDKDVLILLAQLIGAAIERVAHEDERDKLLAALKERERRLEHVIERLFSAQEDERRRVSAELHDSVAQTAGALFRRLEARSHSGTGDHGDDEALAGIAQSLLREIRRVIAGLRPTALDDLGLPAALSGLAEGLRASGYDVDLRVHGEAEWPAVLATAFFRVGQEAMTNIRKHAGGPCRVEIDVESMDWAGVWQLRVLDFGNGPSDGAPHREMPGEHVGIEIMAERMMAVGGTLDVSVHPGGGLLVSASVPGGIST